MAAATQALKGNTLLAKLLDGLVHSSTTWRLHDSPGNPHNGASSAMQSPDAPYILNSAPDSKLHPSTLD